MTLPSGLRRVRQVYGDRPAILTGEKTLTYEQFYRRLLRCAHALHGMGVGKGDRVAVLLMNSPEYLELFLATALYGAVVVPMNIRLGIDEMAFWLNDSGAKVLVVDDRFAGIPAQLAGKLHQEIRIIRLGAEYEELLDASPEQVPPSEPAEEDLAGLFYTSGTTGGPKGVMLSHRNICANALHAIVGAGYTEKSVWLHCAPMFHLANGGAMYAMVLLGAAHTFIPGFEPEAYLRAIERFRVTATVLVPTMVNLLVNHPSVDRYDTRSIERLAYGASPMPVDLLRRAVARFGNVFFQGYGLSEAGPLLTTLNAEDHVFENLNETFSPVKSAGRPVLGVEVRVVDVEDRELPPGESGEIIARGDNVMMGYWNRPEISANTLRDGWLHTGDIGAFDERGFLYILDRAKDMVKTGGENVHSPEVESVIYEHPTVLEAAIIGVPDERWGEAIKAVVVVKQGMSLTADELIAFCRERLTHFKCPSSVDFLDSLPKGGTGKIQKNKLRQPYWEGKERGVN